MSLISHVQPEFDNCDFFLSVWFEDHKWEARAKALCELMQQENADVIALQEVTPRFHKLLLEKEWVRETYAVSDRDGSSLGSYGVMFLVRQNEPDKVFVNSFSKHELDTMMDRDLLVAHLDLWGEPMALG